MRGSVKILLYILAITLGLIYVTLGLLYAANVNDYGVTSVVDGEQQTRKTVHSKFIIYL